MKPATLSPARPRHVAPYVVVGRYAIFDEIAAGGMATVHLGKLAGAGGFSRTVAIKRLHPQFSKDDEFSAMFMDEARLAARIHHPNVVQTLDVVTVGHELLLVMEYVHGVSFASLCHLSRKAGQRIDPRIIAGVVVGALEGLHAAHEAKNEVGEPMGAVHRDVSPQNVLVGVEGTPRILDFGVAKAVGKLHATRDGQLKGKLAYMSPEQVRSQDVTRQSDVFSAAIVLWEALVGKRLFDGDNPAELIMQVMSEPIVAPRTRFPDLSPALDAVVMKGLARDPRDRYATARDMAEALEAAVTPAPPREIGRWVESMASATFDARRELLERIERATAAGLMPEEPRDEPLASHPSLPFAATPDASGVSEKPDLAEPRGLLPDSGTRDRPAPPLGLTGPATPLAYPLGAPPTPVPIPGAPRAAFPSTPPSSGSSSPPGPRIGGSIPPPRPYRIPIHVAPEAEHISLRERIEAPLKVIALGVALSVVDAAARPYLATLPVRPLWIAEILVVAGVLWALARLVLPMRGSRD